MINIYKHLPGKEQLIKASEGRDISVRKVNAHFHTPYSFSAFTELSEVFEMAEKENVDVLGINDFYTMSGYEEFANLCVEEKKFPLFNIEFMGLLKKEQQVGIRVNDPNNPGRTYLSGKGLDFPVSLEGAPMEKLASVRAESDKQTREMVEKASAHLSKVLPGLSLDYDEILAAYTKGMVRERHIAKVIRIKVFEKYTGDGDRKEALKKLYGGVEPKADIRNTVGLDGEIRGMLLKSGGVAFVKEDPKAFLELSQVIRIIIAAGGIPCYPVLLDDKDGNYTDYEADMESLYRNLLALNICSIELIPGRNRMKNLKPFVEFFDHRGFVITFGTEHNTPALDPLTVSVGDAELDPYLLKVSYEGACILATHQYMRSQGEPGYIDESGKPVGDRKFFVNLGDTIIRNFIQ